MSRDRSATFGLMFSVGLGAQKNFGIAAPRGAAGAGKILLGCRRCNYWLYRLATDPSLKWLYRLATDPSLKTHPLPFAISIKETRNATTAIKVTYQKKVFPFLLISATTLRTPPNHQISIGDRI